MSWRLTVTGLLVEEKQSRGDSTPCSTGRLALSVYHPPNFQERLLLIKYCGKGEQHCLGGGHERDKGGLA